MSFSKNLLSIFLFALISVSFATFVLIENPFKKETSSHISAQDTQPSIQTNTSTTIKKSSLSLFKTSISQVALVEFAVSSSTKKLASQKVVPKVAKAPMKKIVKKTVKKSNGTSPLLSAPLIDPNRAP